MTREKKIEALSLAKECYAMKFEVLINLTVVDDTLRFVTEKQQQHSSSKEKRLRNNHDNADSKCIIREEEGHINTNNKNWI